MKRLGELREMLLSREYNKNIINAAFQRVLKIDRKEALKRVVKVKTDRFNMKY